MKKILTKVLVGLLVATATFGFTGCGSKNSATESKKDTAATEGAKKRRRVMTVRRLQ